MLICNFRTEKLLTFSIVMENRLEQITQARFTQGNHRRGNTMKIQNEPIHFVFPK